ncbi:DNA polymerase III subunit gamma and tau, partial [Streptomyces sp. NPDC058084]
PGAWPGASAPAAAPQPQVPAPQAPAPQAAPAAGGSGSMAAGAAQVRNMWPQILEAVKNRRRFTWILLSQNAQVAGFDGTTLQIGFLNAGARDNFASSGSEDVLKAALGEQFNVHWRIEAIIDPSGGANPPPAAGGFSGGGGGGFGGGGFGGGGRPAAPAPAPAYAPAPAPATSQPAPQAAAPAPAPAPAPVQAPAAAPAPQPPPVAPEDDVPEEDDPDLVDSALSGHELIVRELGATVLEEYTNE